MAEALAANTETNAVCIPEDAGLIVEDDRWNAAGTGQMNIVTTAW